MSKYRIIATEFRTLDSLKKALADLDVPYQLAQDPHVPDLGLYGYHNDLRPEKASIAIDRKWLNGHWSYSQEYHFNGSSNDIGFAWDGKSFAAIVSDYDSSHDGVTAAMNKLRQRYAYHETMRLARQKGYMTKEVVNADRTIRIVLSRR